MGLKLHNGLNIERLNDRKKLLMDMDRHQKAITESTKGKQYSLQEEMAFSMLTSPTLRTAAGYQCRNTRSSRSIWTPSVWPEPVTGSSTRGTRNACHSM
ncbi:MAG: hypothetical protein R3C11_02920 [Planctomycetaceae bacterium]